MKKIETAETRTINAGCAYSGFDGHRAVSSGGSEVVATYGWLHGKIYGWTVKTKYTWICGCGKTFFTYFYS